MSVSVERDYDFFYQESTNTIRRRQHKSDSRYGDTSQNMIDLPKGMKAEDIKGIILSLEEAYNFGYHQAFNDIKELSKARIWSR